MLYLKSLFNTKSLPDWFVTINILDLTLAIVCWPFVFFMTMVAFTDHHGTGKPLTGISKIFDMIVFFVIISYPIYIVSMTIINYRLYHISFRLFAPKYSFGLAAATVTILKNWFD